MKALVLLSGGMDSATVGALAVRTHGERNVMGLTINYGQRHQKEITSAKEVARFLGIFWQEITISNVFKGSRSSLVNLKEEVRFELRETPTVRETFQKNITVYQKHCPELAQTFLKLRDWIFKFVDVTVISDTEQTRDAGGNWVERKGGIRIVDSLVRKIPDNKY